MNDMSSYDAAVEMILNQLAFHGRAPLTVKSYRCVYNVFRKYLLANHISIIDEEVCIKYIHTCTSSDIQGFWGTGNDKVNRIMKPLQTLVDYMITGEFISSKRHSRPPYQCPVSFKEEYQLFLEECESRNYSKATISNNRQKVQCFLDYLDKQSVHSSKDIQTSHVTGFLLLYKDAKPKYVGVFLYVLRNYFSFLKQNGYTEEDFSAMLPKLRIMRNAFVPYVWNREDVKKLLDAVDRSDPMGKRDYALLLMVTRLGLRVSDIRSLKLSSLNWNRKTIHLTMVKTKQPIELPLLDDIGWAIIDYLKNGRPKTQSDRVFIRHKAPFDAFGESENFNRQFHRYMVKAGLKTPVDTYCGMHSLRSTLARNMMETKAPLPVISETLGHQNINTTSIYLKVDLEGLRRCALDPEEVFQS